MVCIPLLQKSHCFNGKSVFVFFSIGKTTVVLLGVDCDDCIDVDDCDDDECNDVDDCDDCINVADDNVVVDKFCFSLMVFAFEMFVLKSISRSAHNDCGFGGEGIFFPF